MKLLEFACMTFHSVAGSVSGSSCKQAKVKVLRDVTAQPLCD